MTTVFSPNFTANDPDTKRPIKRPPLMPVPRSITLSITLLVPAPQGMEAPQAVEPPRGTGEGAGTAVEIPTSISIFVLQPGIFQSGGCASATWWYATTHL